MSISVQSPDIKRLVDWIKNNTMPENFDKFSEYLSSVKGEVDHIANDHPFWPYARPILKRFYQESNPDGKIDQQRIHSSTARHGTIKYEIDRRAPESRQFSPSQFAKEFNFNKNTTRREFQALEKEGVLRRVKRGLYEVNYEQEL